MKKLKRLAAVLLALTMVCGMSLTAFAKPDAGTDGTFGTSDDKGTISVSGITPEENITVAAYQIVKAKYDNNGSFSGYEELYGPGSVTNVDKTENESGLAKITVDDAQLAAILAKINTAADGQTSPEAGLVADTKYVMAKSEDGTSYSKDVPVGVYLVVISGAEEKIYSNVVVSLFYTNEGGTGNGIDEGSVKIDDTNANAWTKVQDSPEIEKEITNGDQDTDKGNTVNIGDKIDYKITVPTIPYYGGDYPTFNIVDTLDSTLEFVQNTGCSIKINDGSENGVLFNITENNMIVRASDSKEMGTYAYDAAKNTLTFDFVLVQNGKKVYTLNEYEGKSIEITYSAILTDDAKLSNAANENDVTLNFTHDSKVEGNDGKDDDETFTYTFDIDGDVEGSITQNIITKVGENTVKGERKPLAGAEFTLYNATVAEDGVWTKGDKYTNGDKNKFEGVITSTDKEDNNLAIKGLKAGTYILQETKAPEGYSLNTHEFQIEIVANLDKATGKLQSWSIKIDGKETATFGLQNETIVRTDSNDTVAIPNTSLTELPSTGGIGTTIFTIGGCLIMIIAAGLFFATRKKSAK